MFRNSSNSTSTDALGARTKRGLGPFTGGQLTVIIVTIIVAVVVPVGAWAVSGSNVFVTDSVSGKTAAVNANRQQLVTGSVAVSSGSVTASAAAPASMAVVREGFGGQTTVFFVPEPSGNGKAFVITGIEWVQQAGTAPSQATLSIDGTTISHVVFTSLGTIEDTFPTGVATKNGATWQLAGDANLPSQIGDMVIKGYTVPTSACSAGCY